MEPRDSPIFAILLCCVWIPIASAPRALRAQKPQAISGEAVDQSVVATLSRQGVTKPKVISHIDLTEPFKTETQWTFVAVQDERDPRNDFENHGPLFVCLVNSASPSCDQQLYPQAEEGMHPSDRPYQLLTSRVVYGQSNLSSPLLLLKVCSVAGGNGNCAIATALYSYDKGTDRFLRVFLNLTGRNNNQATRFVETGPLQGDLIVNNPTEKAPYTYWIEVYRAGESGQYGRILRYRGVTHYNDGSRLAVADSEMPEILRRLGLWHPGDPLPAPPHLPHGCKILYMRQGEEWCK